MQNRLRCYKDGKSPKSRLMRSLVVSLLPPTPLDPEDLPHGIFHLTVPQRVDQRVQQRWHDDVKEDDEFVSSQGSGGSNVHEHGGHQDQKHHDNKASRMWTEHCAGSQKTGFSGSVG